MTTAQPAPDPGGRLAVWATDSPAEAETVMRLIAEGGRSNDSCLRARQFLEQAIGQREGPLTGADYQRAAQLLDGQGRTQLGEAMDALASVSWELEAAAARWARRHAARPPTQPERVAAAQISNGEVVESGQAGPGVDGAHYTRAYYPRSGTPAVVITTSAMTEEIVNFANTGDAAAWLAARSTAIGGPLPTSATGPASRTAREEELLAFLLRDPRQSAALAGAARPDTFTTHLRAALFAALQWAAAEGGAPGYTVIAGVFGRRLLRAPADAAADIGWPNASRAMAYLNRLVVTPVTESQAAAAAGLLAAAEATSAPRPARAPAPAARQAPAARVPVERPPLRQPPALAPGLGSPAPRL